MLHLRYTVHYTFIVVFHTVPYNLPYSFSLQLLYICFTVFGNKKGRCSFLFLPLVLNHLVIIISPHRFGYAPEYSLFEYCLLQCGKMRHEIFVHILINEPSCFYPYDV